MTESVRAFFAVRVPATRTVENVLDALRGMGRALKCVDAGQLHITLKFLGDTKLEQLDPIAAIAGLICAGERPFEFQVRGLGAFPHAGRPTVVWAGVRGGEGLVRLATQLETSLVPLGFPAEGRPFKPHLTLARVKARPPTELAGLLGNNADTEYDPVRVDAIELFRSDPGSDGPVYSSLARFPLHTG